MNTTQQDHTEHATSYPKHPRHLRQIAAKTNDLAFGAHIALMLVQASREAERDGNPPTLDALQEEALLRLASAVLKSLADQAVGELLSLDDCEV